MTSYQHIRKIKAQCSIMCNFTCIRCFEKVGRKSLQWTL